MASSGAPSGSETEEGSNAVVFSFPRTDSYLEAVSRDGKGFAAGPSSAAPAEGVSRPAGSAAQPAKCFRKTLWDPRNLLSFISFAWLTPMLKVGFRRTIQSDDFPGLPSRHESERITDRLEMYWQREVAKPSPSILNALHCAFAFNFWGFALLSVVDVTLLTLQPFFLTRLVRNLTNNDPDGETYANAAGLCLVTIFFAILLHTWALESWRTGMEARTGAMGMIYRKVLRMSTQALADTTTGHVITMVSVDVERFIEGVVFAPSLVIGPCQMIGERKPLTDFGMGPE